MKEKATENPKAPVRLKTIEAAPPLQLLAGSRHEGESDGAVRACNDYVKMRRRSLHTLWREYTKTPQDPQDQKETERDSDAVFGAPVPTLSLDTLKDWCKKYEWRMRATLYDAHYEAMRDKNYELELSTGIARPERRVQELKETYDLLMAQLEETDEHGELKNLWLLEPKVVKEYVHMEDGEYVGKTVEKTVYLPRYNAALVNQALQVLDAMAQETGGRRLKDQEARIIEAIIKKVGYNRIPKVILQRMGEGESVFEAVLDVIERLPAETLAALDGESGRVIDGGTVAAVAESASTQALPQGETKTS